MGAPRFDDIEGEPLQRSGAPRFDDIDAPAPAAIDPGLLATIGHKALSGFWKKHSDELVGRIIEARLSPDPGGSVQWRDPTTTSGTRALRTSNDVYEAGRNSERATLKGAEEYHPTASFFSEVGGDLASDAVLKVLAKVDPNSGVYRALMGALSGAGASEKEGLAQVPAAAVSGALSYGIPKVGGVVLRKTLGSGLGARLSDAIGQRIKGAEAEIGERAAEKLAKAAGEAWGPYGQKVAEANRMLEVIDRRFPGAADDVIAAALQKEGHPITAEGLSALREQLFKSSAEKFGKIGGELAAKKEGWEAFKAGAAELSDQLTQQEGSVARQVVPWVKRYAPPVVGSLFGGPAGAAAGVALSGSAKEGAEQAAGALAGAGMRPALQATLRRLAHPAMRKAGLQAADAALRGAAAAGESGFVPSLARPAATEAVDEVTRYVDYQPTASSSPSHHGRRASQKDRAKALRELLTEDSQDNP